MSSDSRRGAAAPAGGSVDPVAALAVAPAAASAAVIAVQVLHDPLHLVEGRGHPAVAPEVAQALHGVVVDPDQRDELVLRPVRVAARALDLQVEAPGHLLEP